MYDSRRHLGRLLVSHTATDSSIYTCVWYSLYVSDVAIVVLFLSLLLRRGELLDCAVFVGS